MNRSFDLYPISATNLIVVLNEIHADSNHGEGTSVERHDAMEAFHAFDEGALAEAPQALAAYVDYQQRDFD